MKSIKKTTSKHQQNLITLISTLNYMNFKFKQYIQKDILYYFNGNLKRNGHKEVKLKTLQSYLYKLEKTLQITINYHRHLGVNMGTEIYYKLRYSKKECHYRINKYFKDKKEDKFQQRVNAYYKKNCIKNGSVEKWECIYNIYNNKKEEEKKKHESKQYIEKLQIKKYAKKCKFKTNGFLPILDLEISKNDKIKLLKTFKRTENYFSGIGRTYTNQDKFEIKKRKLTEILNETQFKLENKGYNSEQLKIQMQKVYQQYKSKPHFIIESNKYNDLNQIIEKLKKSVEHTKKDTEDKQDIRNNIFSILLEQLKNKVDMQMLIPILKKYLNKQNKLEYSKVVNNHYHYELLDFIENKKDYLRLREYKKIIT